MITDIIFRELEETDIPLLMDIYNYYVTHTTVSLHAQPVALAEFTESLVHTNPRYRTFTILLDGNLQGYVQVMPHKKKQAYDTTGEITIYLHPECVGKGVGTAALQHIEPIAKQHGFHVLVSTICSDNAPSIHSFAKNGYFQCAHFREVGFKWGKFLDIVTFQKII
ncbi:N-acetyltransferase [Paenibacillus sp. SYP-B3998]|uniref:N-acetyltransferase n=1 Tax=Paenibacillus sp. SYP-B3998 TaxID=2678564 RepID=A0A6G3ZVR0_9BACL|nr:GNAT family N-acetyltransferase [Paenibacillus sp. SYP-B3998]NEW05497.1 N-acetyltransferase [Paenibacillus sp. SYP-B3998]